MGSCKIKK